MVTKKCAWSFFTRFVNEQKKNWKHTQAERSTIADRVTVFNNNNYDKKCLSCINVVLICTIYLLFSYQFIIYRMTIYCVRVLTILIKRWLFSGMLQWGCRSYARNVNDTPLCKLASCTPIWGYAIWRDNISAASAIRLFHIIGLAIL